jgi:hypothetical protein
MLVSNRATNMLLVIMIAIGIGIVAMLASGARGGPLDPAGTPASTMHTLDDSPVVWDRALPANDGPDSCHSSRFLCVLGSGAVLDRETGLVWQRTPPSGTESWVLAVEDCMNAQLGGRSGWRLPRIEEYRTLLDATGVLPAGHPFSNVLTSLADYYWSASSNIGFPDEAYIAGFQLSQSALVEAKSLAAHPWCVRAAIPGVQAN